MNCEQCSLPAFNIVSCNYSTMCVCDSLVHVQCTYTHTGLLVLMYKAQQVVDPVWGLVYY